jgi:hypothetical protein
MAQLLGAPDHEETWLRNTVLGWMYSSEGD